MWHRSFLVLLVLGVAVPARAQAFHNYVDAIKRLAAEQDALTKEVVGLLVTAKVRTPTDATAACVKPLVDPPNLATAVGLDARDSVTATGLFFVNSYSAPQQRDLVWQVSIERIGMKVVRLMWVSATTGVVRQLYP